MISCVPCPRWKQRTNGRVRFVGRTNMRAIHATIATALLGLSSLTPAHAQQAVTIGDGDLGGVVTSANGPEGGVWGIAETPPLPTKSLKIAGPADRGRYVLPALPKANYDVWVRGYGL